MTSPKVIIIFLDKENNFHPEAIVGSFTGAEPIAEALSAVGDLLAADGMKVAVVVVGGATLNLLGIVHRSTGDVDVIAQAYRTANGDLQLAHAEPFPPALARAIRTVARDFGLAEHWMNAAVGKQWTQGLPPGIERDISWRTYGGLDVGLVGRRTLMMLKLFAAADRGPTSVHVQDLLELDPTDSELREAATWVQTQDAAENFPRIINDVIVYVQQHRR